MQMFSLEAPEEGNDDKMGTVRQSENTKMDHCLQVPNGVPLSESESTDFNS